MLVDDEMAFLYPMKRMMQKNNLEIDIADNYEKAVELIEKRFYDAVIADVRLSGSLDTNGLNILSMVKSKSDRTKVLIMTGFGGPDIMKHAYSGGADFYLEKPVSINMISGALASMGVL